MRVRNDPYVTAAVLALHVLLLTSCLAGSAAGLRFALAADDYDVTETTAFRTDGDETATAIPFGGIDDDAEGLSTGQPRTAETSNGTPPVSFAAEPAPKTTTTARSGEGRWVQRIQAARSRSLQHQQLRADPDAARTAVAALPFGRAIAEVLYGAPWPASRATPKCADDMRIYNEHARNFTLWAAKSEWIFVLKTVSARPTRVEKSGNRYDLLG